MVTNLYTRPRILQHSTPLKRDNKNNSGRKLTKKYGFERTLKHPHGKTLGNQVPSVLKGLI